MSAVNKYGISTSVSSSRLTLYPESSSGVEAKGSVSHGTRAKQHEECVMHNAPPTYTSRQRSPRARDSADALVNGTEREERDMLDLDRETFMFDVWFNQVLDLSYQAQIQVLNSDYNATDIQFTLSIHPCQDDEDQEDYFENVFPDHLKNKL
ncbi:hypothetical protein D9613_006389 [Agrocybe pediades]|uniref:Uncharacterized protein n=1 Tax=Agrocybe pediades TaxID=84607 RepID=A0A8H4QVQ0_9AGAR|nr:hypothetical protein D9613_006389 [Agrocybe pediades]